MLYGEAENRHDAVLKADLLRRAAEAMQADRPDGCVLQAVRKALHTLGWRCSSMTTLTTDVGVVLDLTKATPPQQLKRYLREAFDRMLDVRIWQAAAQRDLVAGEHTGFSLLALRRVLRAPARKMEMWVLRRLLAKLWQVLPTADWLNRHGWQISPQCLCGELDNEAHRLGGCFLTIDSGRWAGRRQTLGHKLERFQVVCCHTCERASLHVL